MSDPDPQTEPSTEVTSQLEALEQYDHQRRTWELELLISGAVVFAALSLPGMFDAKLNELLIHVSRNQSLLAVALPPLLCSLADRKLKSRPPEEWEGRWYVKLIRAVLTGFQWITLRPLYSSIQLILMTNTPKKVTYPLYYVGILGLMAYLFSGLFLQLFDKPAVHGYLYFPDVRVERSVDYRHYESLQPAGKILRREPSIQSDMIYDPFVRLFIPYSPRHNRRIAKLCPELEPIPQEGLSLKDFRPPEASIDAALDCLGSFHLVYLNGERLTPDFDFFTRPETGVRGIVTYLPTDGLPRGRNALRIERVEIDDEDEDEKKEGEEDEPPIEYHIPFWF